MKSSTMVRSILAIGFVTALLASGCSSDDSGGASTPVEGCKSFVSLYCEKIFGCFDTDQLDPNVVGNNKADCKTKLTGTRCTDQKTKCDSGKDYQPSAAKECLSQFDDLSCDQVTSYVSGQTGLPAACDDSELCQ